MDELVSAGLRDQMSQSYKMRISSFIEKVGEVHLIPQMSKSPI